MATASFPALGASVEVQLDGGGAGHLIGRFPSKLGTGGVRNVHGLSVYRDGAYRELPLAGGSANCDPDSCLLIFGSKGATGNLESPDGLLVEFENRDGSVMWMTIPTSNADEALLDAAVAHMSQS